MKHFEDYVVGEQQVATSSYRVTEDGIIQTLSTVFNQRDEVVFSYKGAFPVLRRDAAQQA